MAGTSEKLKGKLDTSDNGEEKGLSIEEQGLLSLEKLNLGPRKKLIILSLGGLLCDRICRRETSKIPTFRHPDASYGSMLVYRRPYCEEFMKFCLERFEVGIWSSAREWYLDSALDCIMEGLRSKLLFAWDQNKCIDSGFYTLENRNKPVFLKKLKEIWQYLNPKNKEKYSASNTLLIDANPSKALLNPPYTAIFPPKYEVNNTKDKDLGPEGELRLYLDGFADAEDIPSYLKSHPFGQSPITHDHPDWKFYSKIISSLK